MGMAGPSIGGLTTGTAALTWGILPASTSSWAMRQALVEWVGTRAWEPLWIWRARRAATRTLRKFESNLVSIVIGFFLILIGVFLIGVLLKVQLLLAGRADDSKGFQHGLEPLLGVGLQAGGRNLQHAAGIVRDGLAIAIIALGQHNGLQLRYRPVQRVVDKNITVLAIILNLLAGCVQPPVHFLFVLHPLGAAAIAQAGTEHLGVGRHDKDADGLRHGGADLRGSLDVDVQEQIVAVHAGLFERLASGPVVAAEDLGVLQKHARGDHALELLAGGEVVLAAVFLRAAWNPRGPC